MRKKLQQQINTVLGPVVSRTRNHRFRKKPIDLRGEVDRARCDPLNNNYLLYRNNNIQQQSLRFPDSGFLRRGCLPPFSGGTAYPHPRFGFSLSRKPALGALGNLLRDLGRSRLTTGWYDIQTCLHTNQHRRDIVHTSPDLPKAIETNSRLCYYSLGVYIQTSTAGTQSPPPRTSPKQSKPTLAYVIIL